MKNKHVKRINLLLSILLGAGVFIFFGVYYSYHLHYQEQFQMFLFTSDYFVEQVSHPGGMADYLGGFLTQFYYYSWAGAAILTGAIGGIHRLMVWIANRLGGRPAWYALLYVSLFCSATKIFFFPEPSLWEWCWEHSSDIHLLRIGGYA